MSDADNDLAPAEAVLVCIQYADFLALTLPSIVATFDRVVVVTEESDTRTLSLCDKLGAIAVCSARRNFRGLSFNLPALVNDGIRALERNGFICKLDSDIFLPEGIRRILRASLVDKSCLYGARRWFCEDYATFCEYQRTGDISLLEPPYEGEGNVLGFLQCFHASSPHLRNGPFYEEERYEAPSLTNDRLFREQFPQSAWRILSSDVVHLGLDPIGTNWNGRRSPPFL